MATVHATGHMSCLCCWAGLVGLFNDDQAALLWRCFPGGIIHIEEDSEVSLAAAHAPGQIIRKANPAMAGRCYCEAKYISVFLRPCCLLAVELGEAVAALSTPKAVKPVSCSATPHAAMSGKLQAAQTQANAYVACAWPDPDAGQGGRSSGVSRGMQVFKAEGRAPPRFLSVQTPMPDARVHTTGAPPSHP